MSVARSTPALYRDGLEQVFLTPRVFWTWMTEGILHAALVMFLPFMSWGSGDITKNGTTIGLWDYGTLVFLCVILVATLRLTVEVRLEKFSREAGQKNLPAFPDVRFSCLSAWIRYLHTSGLSSLYWWPPWRCGGCHGRSLRLW